MTKLIISKIMAKEHNQLNFTYWLGAGASAVALPTVANFKQKLTDYPKTLNDEERNLLGTSLERVFAEFTWLGNSITDYTSPDTFAKVAHLKGANDLLARIKNALTLFFFLEESDVLLKSPHHDPRYINFLASVCKDHPSFPNNLKILSWN